MKVSLAWLKTIIEVPTDDPEVIADVFANLGHEVEGYEVIKPEFRG